MDVDRSCHWGHKNGEHLGTGMGWGAASHAKCVAPTFPLHQAPAAAPCTDFTAASQQSKNGGEKKKAINSTEDKEFDGGDGKAGNGFGR